MIISFAWTTPALLAGVKTVTRRTWNRRYAEQFARLVEFGGSTRVDAYDRSPRNGGRKVATIALVTVAHEQGYRLTASDREREGVTWSERNGIAVPEGAATWDEWWRLFRDGWATAPEGGYRVEFELIG